MKNKWIKFSTILIISLPILLLINTGFLNPSIFKVLQTVFFGIIFAVSLVWKEYKRFILLLALLLIIGTSVLYTIDIIEGADMAGSTGIGVVLLVILSYLSELIKNGYIKKI